MIPTNDLLLFAGAALLMVLTPGPNMIYLISRSICQGRKAGVVSLFGVIAGFLVHMLAAAIGLTALLLAVPLAYEALRWAGAAYLLWLAWQALRPGARSLFEPRQLPPDSTTRLFVMGFLTNALNPKVALFILAFLPQFTDPARGPLPLQIGVLGLIFIAATVLVFGAFSLLAGVIGDWFRRSPRAQRLLNRAAGLIFAGLALKLALTVR